MHSRISSQSEPAHELSGMSQEVRSLEPKERMSYAVKAASAQQEGNKQAPELRISHVFLLIPPFPFFPSII
jgi:hypothetical protein